MTLECYSLLTGKYVHCTPNVPDNDTKVHQIDPHKPGKSRPS